MLDAEGARIRGLEVIQERATKRIGDLKCRAQQHREDEEHEHLLAPEQHEGVESERRDQATLTVRPRRWALRHRECVEAQEERGTRADVELQFALGPARKIDDPHCRYEADGTPHANRRKCLDDVEATLLQHLVGHGVVERDSRHVDHRVQQHDPVQPFEVLDGRRPEQEARTDQVAHAEDALRVDPAVGNDSDEARHKERADAHRRVDAAHLAARETERDDHVGAERDQPRTPHEELREVHHRKAELDAAPCLSFLRVAWPRYLFSPAMIHTRRLFSNRIRCGLART